MAAGPGTSLLSCRCGSYTRPPFNAGQVGREHEHEGHSPAYTAAYQRLVQVSVSSMSFVATQANC